LPHASSPVVSRNADDLLYVRPVMLAPSKC
jgi:hypothetical protein